MLLTRHMLMLVAFLVTGGAGAASQAAMVRCGTVVEEQAVLDRDLRCAGPPVILRNPRTVLQLNGHVLESLESCEEGAAPTGIMVEATADGAQILGPGVIRGFRTGIQVTGAERVQVRDLRISDSCADAVLVVEARDVGVRNVTLHRNGATALRGENTERLRVEGNTIFRNGSESKSRGAAVDLHRCSDCRVTGNRITDNRGAGLRLDVESNGNEIERNVILDHHTQDVVDDGSDNTFVLNAFERGAGVSPPKLWPLIGDAAATPPAVVGCGQMTDLMKPRQTVTVNCPQDPGLRAVRNSVVGYRLIAGTTPYGAPCKDVRILPASSSAGGSVRCTNPDSVWHVILEVTCCLN